MEAAGVPESRSIPVVWVDPTDGKAQWANQFTSTFQPDEFILTFGQVVPPLILGETDEERRAQVEAINFVPVNLIARIALNRTRMVELIGILQKNLAQHDEAVQNRPS